jgi:SH3-like domain-containing protein
MADGAYAPTHAVPGAGMAAFSAPDGRLAPVAQLDPGLDVQVLDWDGAWAHVVCSNGWSTWVDGRLLLGTAAPAPVPAPTPAAAPAWAPTNLTPADGMTTWVTPSPTSPKAERLDAALPVAVTEWQGDWAHVACSNGWSTWVDGRLLQPYAAAQSWAGQSTDGTPGTIVRHGPAAALRLLVMPRRVPADGSALVAIGPFAAAGAALAIVGSFLPLLSVLGFGVSAWQLPAAFLFSDAPAPSGFSLGILLLITALVALPLLLRHPLPPLALLAIAAPATNTGVHILLRKLASSDYPDIGIGGVLILIGGFLIVGEALRASWLGRREAFR